MGLDGESVLDLGGLWGWAGVSGGGGKCGEADLAPSAFLRILGPGLKPQQCPHTPITLPRTGREEAGEFSVSADPKRN